MALRIAWYWQINTCFPTENLCGFGYQQGFWHVIPDGKGEPRVKHPAYLAEQVWRAFCACCSRSPWFRFFINIILYRTISMAWRPRVESYEKLDQQFNTRTELPFILELDEKIISVLLGGNIRWLVRLECIPYECTHLATAQSRGSCRFIPINRKDLLRRYFPAYSEVAQSCLHNGRYISGWQLITKQRCTEKQSRLYLGYKLLENKKQLVILCTATQLTWKIHSRMVIFQQSLWCRC